MSLALKGKSLAKNLPRMSALRISGRDRMMTTFKEREHAMEEAYFNREEAKLLQKMMSKIKKNVDTKEGEKMDHYDSSALKEILGTQASPEVVAKLMDWKYHCHDETH